MLVAGCGGGRHDSSRAALKIYVQRVNAIQVALRKPLAAVSTVNKSFSTRADLDRLAPRLARSQATVRTLQLRLRGVDPPPQARVLQARLLALVGAERALLDELHATAVFLPRFRASLARLSPVGAQLTASLRGVKSAPEEASVLEAYAHGLAAPIASLRALRAPPVFRPTWRTELGGLTALRADAASLAAALRAKRPPAEIRRRVLGFERAAASGGSLAAQRAQIAAVKAFDARVKRLNVLVRRVQVEYVRVRGTT